MNYIIDDIYIYKCNIILLMVKKLLLAKIYVVNGKGTTS